MQPSASIILSALDQDDSAIVVLRPDAACVWRIVSANLTCTDLLGFTKEEVIGTSLSRFHGPSTSPDTQKSMDEAMRSGNTMRGQIELLSRQGRSFWFGFTLMMIVDPLTGCLHCVMLGRDITAKLRQDREQAALQDLLVSAFQKANAAVMIVASDKKIVLSNEAAQAMTGYPPSELHRLTTLQLQDPEYHALSAQAHQRQMADGLPYQFEFMSIHKDGSKFPVHITSALVERADNSRFRVVTMLRVDAEPKPRAAQILPQSVIGSIHFLGLDAVRAVYGPRWSSMRDRLMLTIEGILKRRLSEEDVFNRTAEDGFNVWFKHGSEEANALNLDRIARQIRIALLGELGEEANLAVGTYTATAQLDPAASQSAMMANVSQRLAARRRLAEQQARELIARVTAEQPRELVALSDRSGQSARAAFVDLPRDLRGRFSAAMSLVGEAHSDIDVEMFRIGLAIEAALDSITEGSGRTHFVAVPFGLFMQRRGRDRFLQQWRAVAPAVQGRLAVLVTELPPEVTASRVKEVADLLRPIMKAVAVELNEIERLPFTLLSVPFNIVGLASEAVAKVLEVRLQAFILKVHNAKRHVLVRLAIGESPERWQKLGVDLTAAF